ncbi:MAG: hypothetical protein E7549_04910 [Ruminococcaceae bacterium]|nr:hypothetical protein [Oscillospiraceae bacterium]
MKKFVACLLMLVLCLSVAVSAFAETVEFVPSISYKPAPGVVATDPAGHEDCIVIVPVAEADTSKDITADEAATLKKVYNELSKDGVKLSEQCPDLTDLVKKVLGEGKTADDLVVRDLFHVGATCEEIPAYLADGKTLKLTLDSTVGKDEKVFAMLYKDGKWVALDNTVNNGDNTITVELDELGPVAIMVPASVGSDDTQTGENSHTTLWIVIMLAALVAMVVSVLLYRRRADAE